MFDFEKIVLFICNLLKQLWEKIRKNSNGFEKIRISSTLKIRNSIQFEGKIIRFIRFEKFSIQLIRKSFFNSKNSTKIYSKFIRFDSTPPLMKTDLIMQMENFNWQNFYLFNSDLFGKHLWINFIGFFALKFKKTLK